MVRQAPRRVERAFLTFSSIALTVADISVAGRGLTKPVKRLAGWRDVRAHPARLRRKRPWLLPRSPATRRMMVAAFIVGEIIRHAEVSHLLSGVSRLSLKTILARDKKNER
jgi:hypothetical protein